MFRLTTWAAALIRGAAAGWVAAPDFSTIGRYRRYVGITGVTDGVTGVTDGVTGVTDGVTGVALGVTSVAVGVTGVAVTFGSITVTVPVIAGWIAQK